MTTPDDHGADAPSFAEISQRLASLRKEMKANGIDGFIVPRGDEHQGEYVPPSAERLAWLTGFTGSAGLAIVLADCAAIFIDGRYTLQVLDEVPQDSFTIRHLINEPATDWIQENLGEGQALAFDPWLLTPNHVRRYRSAAEKAGGKLVPVESNPLDAVWNDQPEPPKGKVVIHDIAYAGVTSEDKRHTVADEIRSAGQDAVLLSAPDSIAWLLNIRGSDLTYVPQPLSFALVHNDARVDWFIDPDKPSEDLAQHLGPDISRHEPGKLGGVLDSLGQKKASVRLSYDADPEWAADRLRTSGATVVAGQDPCMLPKAIKNETELEGMRRAHQRDGVAVSRFLCWLEKTAVDGGITEIDAADYLENCRRETGELKGLSFPTIAGAGPNGAICHYRVTEQSNRRLELGSLFLVDSGGQYLDGTTDITRTVPVGEPTDEMCENFTRVLRGHIAIATARFPLGTTGSQLDPFARRPLWDVGLDYDHGTGHGVGSYLNVHEGPHRISKVANSVALVPGMVVSNEPGYYKADEYGIRIENLVAVCSTDAPSLGFETLTTAPIDRRLVVPGLMETHEIDWLNDYHAWVREQLMADLDSETAAWLKAATEPVSPA